MIAYHMNRDHTLKEGQLIELYKIDNNTNFLTNIMFQDGLSHHGLHYVDESIQNLYGNQPSFYVLEYELELIRRAYFPQFPSRFQSFFAIDDIKKIQEWTDIFGDISDIWKIEFDETNYIIRDSNLLYVPFQDRNGCQTFCQNNAFYYGYNYWKGSISDNPRLEILVKPPIRVIEKMTLV